MPPKTPTETDLTVGQRITTLRKAAGMSQTMLGEALGISFQQVQKYEKGMNRISGSRLQSTAHALGVPVSALFDEAGNKMQSEALSFLSAKGAIELLTAFVAIQDKQMRRDVLALVRSVSRLALNPISTETAKSSPVSAG